MKVYEIHYPGVIFIKANSEKEALALLEKRKHFQGLELKIICHDYKKKSKFQPKLVEFSSGKAEHF